MKLTAEQVARHIIVLLLPDSQCSSADLSSRPYSHSSSTSDADRNATSGAEQAAGNVLQTALEQRSRSWPAFDSFLLSSMSPLCSGGNSEELHVGKISFAPLEVLGHGTAGTFVFRYDTDAHNTAQCDGRGHVRAEQLCFSLALQHKTREEYPCE